MAAPKGEKDLNKLFDEIITDIAENGSSAIGALKGRMSTQTFYILLEDDEKSKRYARATEMRAEKMAHEMLEIADNRKEDFVETEDGGYVDHNVINRDRLRVDSRKWLLAKLHPKKYGDKFDMTSGDLPINPHITIELIDSSDKITNEDPGSK